MKSITITAKTMDLIKTLFWEGMSDAKLTKRQKTKLLTEFLEDKSRLRALVNECLRRHFAARVVTRSTTARPINHGACALNSQTELPQPAPYPSFDLCCQCARGMN